MNASIALFDSGLGGLTVMREIRRLCPHENLIYFGDTARVPYGNRSPETIRRFTLESVHFLLTHEIKLLVIACNTVASWALPEIKELLPSLPIIDVVTAGARACCERVNDPSILLLATRATVASKSYLHAIKDLSEKASLFELACPLFVPLVEEGLINHEATRLIAKEYLTPHLCKEIDLLLLGCTHYPPLAPTLQKIVGDKVTIIDSATSTAHDVKRLLQELHLENEQKLGSEHFFVSDDPAKFSRLGPHFYGAPIHNVEQVPLEELLLHYKEPIPS